MAFQAYKENDLAIQEPPCKPPVYRLPSLFHFILQLILILLLMKVGMPPYFKN